MYSSNIRFRRNERGGCKEMTKHTHAFVSISETKEKCALCDQYRKKNEKKD